MRNTMKTIAVAALLSSVTFAAQAADYVIDTGGAHASVNFRIKHLGYSWLTGRFDKFGGSYSFDEADPAQSSITVEIDTASVNSNLGERDNHLRSADFLDVKAFPTARFASKSFVIGGEHATITGDLTLHGVTREITISADYVGGGKDPWGGYRTGFTGTTQLTLADFGMTYNLGPASAQVELILNIEGIRQ